MRPLLWTLLAIILAAGTALGQSVTLNTVTRTGTIDANGDVVELTVADLNGGGIGSVKVQTMDSYTGTWEVQCSVDGVTYDTASELKLTPTDGTTIAYSVSDTVAIWDVGNASACQKIRVIATAGFAASDTVVAITATQSGGGGGGGASAVTVDFGGVEDAAETAGGTLGMAGCVRRDTAASSAGTTGDNATINCDATGNLWVIDSNSAALLASMSSAATSLDNIELALAPESTHGNAVIATGAGILGEAKDIDGSALPNVVTEGQAIRIATTLAGATLATLVHEDGLTSPIVNEDVAETAANALLALATVRRDTAASSAGTAGDWATLNTDGLGRLWVRDGDPCSDPARITSAAITESTAATNEIVALNGSDLIYVCSYKFVTTAANSLSWTRGTGVDCGTGTTAIEGAQPYAANGGAVESGGGHTLFVVAAGNALCLVSSAATAHGGRVSYVRTAAP